jgi:hypothetical protein
MLRACEEVNGILNCPRSTLTLGEGEFEGTEIKESLGDNRGVSTSLTWQQRSPQANPNSQVFTKHGFQQRNFELGAAGRAC